MSEDTTNQATENTATAEKVVETMRVFRASFKAGDEPAQVTWHPSKSAADKHIADLQKAGGDAQQDAESVTEIRLPKDKKGMLEWLNENVKS